MTLKKKYYATPENKFYGHMARAKRRGIPFELTFNEWWDIWTSSGHWNERGRYRHQYVMARHGDVGPYAVGNVKIITNSENVKEVCGERSIQAKLTNEQARQIIVA